jgi:peptidoglycan hydrolase-like protein with peptidoglycan-binding domain
MKNTTLVGVLIGCTLFAGASVALAQTYVYPVTPVNSTYYPPAPIASSCASFTVYQQFGSSDSVTGGQVTALQQLLNREGYLSGVTGYFDQGTVGAVANFQRAHGIFSTGTVGKLCKRIQRLCKSCCTSFAGIYATRIYSSG